MNNAQPKNKTLIYLGIIFLPIIFVWFTLRKGFRLSDRVAAFCYLGVSLFVMPLFPQLCSSIQELPDHVEVNTASVENSTSTRSKKQKNKTYDMNEKITLGNFEYVVTKAELTSRIGRRFGREDSTTGALFLIISYTIENVGKKTDSVLTDDFHVIDGKGLTFTSSSRANTALSMANKNKELFLTQLQPGLKREMMTAFEVPEKSIKSGVALVIPEKGFFGTKKAIVALSN